MNDFFVVQIFETRKNAGWKKPHLLLGEFMLFADVIAKVSTRHQVHNQVQVLPILKGLLHVYDEFVFDLSEQFPFVSDRLQAFFCENASLK